MAELTALLRVSLSRHGWLLLVMITVVFLGTSFAWVSMAWFPQSQGSSLAAIGLFLSLMPAGIASIVLFDYGLDQDLSLPESGCSHWMLRMPIQSWKIALVPAILKSIWVSGLWGLFILFVRLHRLDSIPLIMPCVVFSAIAIWILVISWRPFRSSLSRLLTLAIAALVCYGILVGVFASASIEDAEWRVIAGAASVVSGISLYVGGVWCLIRSTQLARVSPHGVVAAADNTGRWLLPLRRALRDETVVPIRQYSSQLQALFHHDYQMSIDSIRMIYLIAVIPAILIFALLIPVNAGSVIVLLIWFVYVAFFSISRSISGSDSNGMPAYLAASPLSTKALSWGRQLFPLTMAGLTYLCIILVIAGWTCWEGNRAAWIDWAEAQAASAGGVGEAIDVGIRLSIAIVLGVGVVLLSRIVAFAWVGMTGRNWVGVVWAAVLGLAFLVLVGMGLRWFMSQTDWESTRESAMVYLAMLPGIVSGLLITKMLSAVVVAAQGLKRRLISSVDVMVVIAGWGVLTLVLAVIFTWLLPYPFATFAWCLALTALVIPLARVFAMPIALDWNRHR